MLILGLLSDLLLLGATLGMAVYCRTLSKRLRAFNDIDHGIGGTVATMSLQVDELKRSIDAAHADADERAEQLRQKISQADDRIGRLEMLLAGLEDIEAEIDPEMHATAQEVSDEIIPSFRAVRSNATPRFTR